MSRVHQCTSCGKLLHGENIRFIHPTLFGGVDKLCKECVAREEHAHNQRMEVSRKKRTKA